jgi:hypothetical protein
MIERSLTCGVFGWLMAVGLRIVGLKDAGLRYV